MNSKVLAATVLSVSTFKGTSWDLWGTIEAKFSQEVQKDANSAVWLEF